MPFDDPRVVPVAIIAFLILLWVGGLDLLITIVKVAIPAAVLIGGLYVVLHFFLNYL